MKSLYRVEFSKSRGNIFVGQSKAQLRGREERGAGNREINISSLKKDISDSNSSISKKKKKLICSQMCFHCPQIQYKNNPNRRVSIIAL